MNTEKTSSPSKTDLSRFDNEWFDVGRSTFTWKLWELVKVLVLLNPFNPFVGIKVWTLRRFGAKIGKGVIIKPRVNVKFPWKLEIGDHTWIGENVWIDNLDTVTIGANCCISQGALLLSGNHNYKKPTFDLMVDEIVIKEGVWIGAQAVVTAGVTCESHAVLGVHSVASSDLAAYSIYQGNPAVKVRDRAMED